MFSDLPFAQSGSDDNGCAVGRVSRSVWAMSRLQTFRRGALMMGKWTNGGYGEPSGEKLMEWQAHFQVHLSPLD